MRPRQCQNIQVHKRTTGAPTHLGQDAGSLGAAHDRDARVGPHEQEVGAECSPTHAIIACPKAASKDERDLWHLHTTSDCNPKHL